MGHPIHILPVSSRRREPAGYHVWVTPRPPSGDTPSDKQGRRLAVAAGERVWMKELAPASQVLRLYREGRMNRAEFEAYYRTRLNAVAARDQIRALACLSLQSPLVLSCECAVASDCYLPILVRSIQDCRDRKDFGLSLVGAGEGGSRR